MATLQERIETATGTLETDAGLMHSIVNGGPTETVETEGGPVPTVAKQVADLKESYAAAEVVATSLRARDEAVAAMEGAISARDEAVVAKGEVEEALQSLPQSTTTTPGISREATIDEATSGESTTPGTLPHVTPEGVAAALVPVKESITAVEDRTTSIESSRGRSATVDLQGMTSYTFGSIPSGARNIRLITTHCNAAVTSAKPFVQIRTSSGLITSNYVGSVVQHGNTNSCLVSSSIVQIELAYNSTNLDFNHCLELRRFPNYGWQWTGVGGFRTNYTTTCGGDIAYNENIIGLTLSLSSGAWATGGAFLEWEK